MVLAARRVQAATGPGPVFGESFPTLARVLEEIHDRRMVQVRMVAVSTHPERAAANECDVIRLRWIRDARPMLRQPVLIRQLRHVRSWAVDVREIVILHEDDDELVEIVRDLRGDLSSAR